MRIGLLKLVDRMVGGIATALLPAPVHETVAQPRRLLFIRPGGIGDAVLLIPVLLALKGKFPDAEISVLAERRNASAFSFCAAVDHLLLYDRPAELARAVRGAYQVVIDTEQWYRLSAVVGRLTRAPMLIGFATNERKRLFTHPVSYSQEQYEALCFFRLVEPLGITPPSRIAVPFLELPAVALQAAEGLLELLGARPFVTVFPGASAPQKQWGTDNFRELTRKLAARDIAVVIVGGGDTRLAARQIARGGPALDLTGRTTLAVTAALIAKGRVLVSGDSGLLHIAAGLGTPTVSLFGPSDLRKWGPKGESDLVFHAGLPCAPCSRFGNISPCAGAAGCLGGITVAQVFAAVETLLGREGA